MSEPTFSILPRLLPAGSPDADVWTISADADAPIRFLPPNTDTAQPTLMEILQSGSLPPSAVRFVGEDPTTRVLSYTITATVKRTGSGDGRGGNARDRRKARRAGRTWRSLGDVVRNQIEQARKDLNESMERAVWHGNTRDLWGLSGHPRLRAGIDPSATATNPNTWRGST